MKELKNNVCVCGVVVKNNIEEFVNKKGNDAIGGSLVLRTSDDSEHEIRLYSDKYKKDENGNPTGEESYFYKEYLNLKENVVDVEHATELNQASVISIKDAQFTVNDFKGKDGKLATANKISAKFINKVEPKDYDSILMIAKFEVEGIIDSITDEIKNNIPTGNLVVMLNAIGQRNKNGKFGKEAEYEADELIPIKMVVDKSMADKFRTAGYYEGCFTKLSGSLINNSIIETVVEKQAFGEDLIKTVKKYDRKNLVQSGAQASSIFEHEMDQTIVDALKSKRKAKIAAVMSGAINSNSEVPFEGSKVVGSTPTPQPQMGANPFNPFMQQ